MIHPDIIAKVSLSKAIRVFSIFFETQQFQLVTVVAMTFVSNKSRDLIQLFIPFKEVWCGEKVGNFTNNPMSRLILRDLRLFPPKKRVAPQFQRIGRIEDIDSTRDAGSRYSLSVRFGMVLSGNCYAWGEKCIWSMYQLLKWVKKIWLVWNWQLLLNFKRKLTCWETVEWWSWTRKSARKKLWPCFSSRWI